MVRFDWEPINLPLERHPVLFYVFGVPGEEELLRLGLLVMLVIIVLSLHLFIVNMLYLNSTQAVIT